MLAASGKIHVVGTARSAREIDHIMRGDPDVTLLNVEQEGEELPHAIRLIHQSSPRCQVVLTAQRDTPLDLLKAMRAGARGLVHKPLDERELINAIQEVHSTEQSRLQRIEEQAKAKATQGRAGEVIAVFSPKGGVGCTVIATHLAAALVEVTKGRVALVDYDLQFGDVAVHLNLQSGHGIHELMRNLDDLDGAILDDVTVPHSSGVRVLLPPPTLDQVEDIETDGLAAVVKAMRKYNDYVVIDMWHSIEDATLALMDLATTLLVVTTPEVPALRSTKRFLDFIRERPDRREKVQIVLNRYPSKSAVDIREVERSLGMRPAGTVASDGKLVTTAVNEGVTILSKRSGTGNNIMQLAGLLAQPQLVRRRQAQGNAHVAGVVTGR